MAGINDWVGEKGGAALGWAGNRLEDYNNEIVDHMVGGFLHFAATTNMWGPLGGEASRQAVLNAYARGGNFRDAVEAYTQHEGLTKRVVLETLLDPLNLALPLGAPKWLLTTGRLAKLGSVGRAASESERFAQAAEGLYKVHDLPGQAIGQAIRPVKWAGGKALEGLRGGAPEKIANAQEAVFNPAARAAQKTPGGLSATGQQTMWAREVAQLQTELARQGMTLEDLGLAGLTRGQVKAGKPVTQEMVDVASDQLRRRAGWVPGAGPDPAASLQTLAGKAFGAKAPGKQALGIAAGGQHVMNPATEIALNAAFASPAILMAKAADEGKSPTDYLPGFGGAAAAVGLGAIALKKPYLGRAIRDVAAGEKFRPGELARSDYIPNKELFEEYAATHPDIHMGEGGYEMSPATLREITADPRFTVNEGIPWDELASPKATEYVEKVGRVREQIARGEMPPEVSALSAILTIFSEGQHAKRFTTIARKLGGEKGLDWIAQNKPTVQLMMQPGINSLGYEETVGAAIRPEVYAAARAMMLHDPDIAVGMTALVRPEAFASEAERAAAVEKGVDKLLADNPFADVNIREMITGRPLAWQKKESTRLPWMKSLPEVWKKTLLPWSTRSSVEGPQATSDALLESFKADRPAGLREAKGRFFLDMLFNPDYATLDSRMLNKVFGLGQNMGGAMKGPNADLYTQLEDMVAAKLPGVESKYVRQWLPWQHITGETTEYNSITNKLDEFAQFFRNAEQRASAEGRPMGEVVREMSQAYPVPEVPKGDVTESGGTWLGITMKDVAKNLQPGAGVDDVLRLYPGIRELADQAGVSLEDFSVGLGQYAKDAARIEEPDLHMLLTGPKQGIEWFAAALAKAGEQREAYVMHPGYGYEMYRVGLQPGGPGREIFSTPAGEELWKLLGDNGWHAYFNPDGTLAGFHITDFTTPESENLLNRGIQFAGVMNRVLDALESEGVQFTRDARTDTRWSGYFVDSLSLNEANYDEYLTRGPGRLSGSEIGTPARQAKGGLPGAPNTRGVGAGEAGSGAGELPSEAAPAVLPGRNAQAQEVSAPLPEALPSSPAISEVAKLQTTYPDDLLGRMSSSHIFVMPDGNLKEVPAGIDHTRYAANLFKGLGEDTGGEDPLARLLSDGVVRAMVYVGSRISQVNVQLRGPITMQQFQAIRGLAFRGKRQGFTFFFSLDDPADPNFVKELASGSSTEELEAALKKEGWLPGVEGPTTRYYHGTSAEFAKPDAARFGKGFRSDYGAGFYLDTNPEVADAYATIRQMPPVGANVHPIDVPNDLRVLDVTGPPSVEAAELRNRFIAEVEAGAHADEGRYRLDLIGQWPDASKYVPTPDGRLSPLMLFKMLRAVLDDKGASEWLERQGYEGVKAPTEARSGKGAQLVVFAGALKRLRNALTGERLGLQSPVPWGELLKEGRPGMMLQASLGPMLAARDEEGNPIIPFGPQAAGGLGIMRGQRGVRASAAQVRQGLRQFGAENPFGYLRSTEAKEALPLPNAAATAAEAPLPAGATPEMAASAIEAFIKKMGLGERGYDITGTVTPEGPGVMVSMNNVPKNFVQQVGQAMADGFGVDVHIVQHALGKMQRGSSAVFHGGEDIPAVMEVQLADPARADEIKAILEERGAKWMQFRNPYRGQGQTSFMVFNIDPATGAGWRREAFEFTQNERFAAATRQLLEDAGATISPAGGNVQTLRPGSAQAPVGNNGGASGARTATGNASRGAAGGAGSPATGGISKSTGGVTRGVYGPFADEPLRRELLDLSDTEKWGVSPARLSQFRSFRDRFQGEYAKAYRSKREASEAFQAAAITPSDWKADVEAMRAKFGAEPAFRDHLKNLQRIGATYGDLDPMTTEASALALTKMERDVAKALGIKKGDPKWEAAMKMSAIWREQALASPANLVYNLTDAISKNGLTGVGMTDLKENLGTAVANVIRDVRGRELKPFLGPTTKRKLAAWGEDALPKEIDSQMIKNMTDSKGLLETHLDIGFGGSGGRALTRAAGYGALAATTGNPVAMVLAAAHGATLPVQSKLFRALNAAGELAAREGQFFSAKEKLIAARLPAFAKTLEAAGLPQVASDVLARRGEMSVIDVRKLVKDAGGADDLAKTASDSWNAILAEGTNAGIEQANKVHFDYVNTNADEFFRHFFAFHFWATRNIPYYAEFLAEHPGLPMILWRYNVESGKVSEDKNLTQRFGGMVGTGNDALGSKIGNALFGREGEVFFNPLLYLSIMSQAKPVKGGEDDPEGRKLLNQMGNVGLGLHPAIAFPLNQFGEKVGLGNAPVGNIVRASAPISALAGAAAGAPVDIEAGLKGGSFDFNRYYILKRIAEMSVERMGVPNAAPYVQAMGDPSSPIYQEAAKQVARENLTSSLASYAGVPLKFLPQTEANVRGAAKGLEEIPEGGSLAERQRAVLIRRQQKASHPLTATYDIPNREASRSRGDSQQGQSLSAEEDAIWQAWKKAGAAERAVMWANPDVRYVVQKRQLMGYK